MLIYVITHYLFLVEEGVPLACYGIVFAPRTATETHSLAPSNSYLGIRFSFSFFLGYQALTLHKNNYVLRYGNKKED